MDVPGPHRLLVINETDQESGNFKYNGAAVAVHRILREHPDTETFVSGTAGNFGGALAAVVHHLNQRDGINRKVQLFAPAPSLPEVQEDNVKKVNMERYGAAVEMVDGPVTDAIERAEAYRDTHPKTVFVHPFNNLDAISGQALVGRRIAEGLRQHRVTGPVIVPVQLGGGSLISGVASVLHEVNLPDLQVFAVRPDLVNGNLDVRYDGLAVRVPGDHAATLLNDPSFVSGGIEVSVYDTGRAAHQMAWAFHGRRFEPSGLAGAAAYERLAGVTSEPTTFVVILSGANVPAKIYDQFADAPRRWQNAVLGGLAMAPRSLSSSLGKRVLNL